MKWLIIPAIATSFVSLHATKHIQIQHGHAQEQHQAEKGLNLTKEQAAQVAEVRFQMLRKFINAHIQNKEITPDEHKKAAETAVAELNRILTASQRQSLEGKGGSAALLDMMKAIMELFGRLKVTKEQHDQLHDLFSAMHGKKDGGGHAQGDPKTTHEHLMRQIHGILTPDQIKRMHELLQNGKA